MIFNSTDSHMMTGSVEGKLHIYDLMKSAPVQSIQAHRSVLSSIGIHEQGGMVTAAHDGSIAYWSL